jgi:hypothetical protein
LAATHAAKHDQRTAQEIIDVRQNNGPCVAVLDIAIAFCFEAVVMIFRMGGFWAYPKSSLKKLRAFELARNHFL